MNTYLYDIFQTSAKNSCSDLTVALAMFLSDAREGRQQYGPDGLDYAALHQDYPQLDREEAQIRRFIGRHYEALTKAYQTRDRALFDQTAAQCQADDLALAQAEETKP